MGRYSKNSGGGNIADLSKRYSNLGGMRNFDQKREMHKAKCADCGKECNVPFKPQEGRPIYCRECYPKHRPRRDKQ